MSVPIFNHAVANTDADADADAGSGSGSGSGIESPSIISFNWVSIRIKMRPGIGAFVISWGRLCGLGIARLRLIKSVQSFRREP